jgi:hypothetical protein
MWPSRSNRLAELESGLAGFSNEDTQLLGIKDPAARSTLAKQMIASLRRLDFTEILKARNIHPDRTNPKSSLFDPDRAALFYARNGNIDEAIWLIFLSIHFGKNGKYGWRMMRDVYSGLGDICWTWKRISAQPETFREWLKTNRSKIGGAFGNHRKYETLDVRSKKGTATVIESFVELCRPSPSAYFASLVRKNGNDPEAIFDAAYHQLKIVRFGRLAKFDFLALLGRMDLTPLKPGSAYLRGATGPLKGTRLLVDGRRNSTSTADDLDVILRRLGKTLNVGMQVLEDSICNWQKSPRKFKHFRG